MSTPGDYYERKATEAGLLRSALVSARRRAQQLDDEFSAELQRVYGKAAGDARYRYSHSDPIVTAASEAKREADREVHRLEDALRAAEYVGD